MSSQKGTAWKLFRPACTNSVRPFSCFRISSVLTSSRNQKMKSHTQSRDLPGRPAPLPPARFGLPALHGSRTTNLDSHSTIHKSRCTHHSPLITCHSTLPFSNRYPIIRYPSNFLATNEKTFSNRYYFSPFGACSAPRHSLRRQRERWSRGGSESRPYNLRRG